MWHDSVLIKTFGFSELSCLCPYQGTEFCQGTDQEDSEGVCLNSWRKQEY